MEELRAFPGNHYYGFLVYTYGWRWVFWYNVPMGIIGLIWGIFTLRPIPGRAKAERVDAWGNFTLALWLGGLILALSEGGITGWFSFPVIIGVVTFCIFLPCFIWVERRAKFPMIDFTLFRSRSYVAANLATFLNFMTLSSVMLLITLYFQVVNHQNPFSAGIKVLPLTLGMIVASPVVGALSAKYNARLLSTVGLIINCSGMFLLTWNIGNTDGFFWIGLGLFMIGIGHGVFLTPNTKSIMLSVPLARRGVANGLRSMLQNLGQLISTAFSLMIVTSFLPPLLKDVIYAGAAAQLAPNDLLLIAKGYRFAFLIMMWLIILAILASYLRQRGEKVIEKEISRLN